MLENQRGDREVDLINETRSQGLADDRRAASEPDVVALCGVLGLCERGLNPVGNELEDRAARAIAVAT
jgi:hypothetical protein